MSRFNKPYKENLCGKLIEKCKKGYSILSFAADQEVTLKTLGEWAKLNPDFEDALEISKYCEIQYWEDRYIDAMNSGDKVSASMAQFALNQRYDLYRDAYKKTDPTNLTPQSYVVKSAFELENNDINRDILQG